MIRGNWDQNDVGPGGSPLRFGSKSPLSKTPKSSVVGNPYYVKENHVKDKEGDELRLSKDVPWVKQRSVGAPVKRNSQPCFPGPKETAGNKTPDEVPKRTTEKKNRPKTPETNSPIHSRSKKDYAQEVEFDMALKGSDMWEQEDPPSTVKDSEVGDGRRKSSGGGEEESASDDWKKSGKEKEP
jgi:hypothetical protein